MNASGIPLSLSYRSSNPSYGFRFGLRLLLLGALMAMVGGCASDIITNGKESRDEGIKLYNDGNYADAAGAFGNAIRTDPRDFRSQYYLGASFEQMRQY